MQPECKCKCIITVNVREHVKYDPTQNDLAGERRENKGLGFPMTSSHFIFTLYRSALRNEVCLLADMKHTS